MGAWAGRDSPGSDSQKSQIQDCFTGGNQIDLEFVNNFPFLRWVLGGM